MKFFRLFSENHPGFCRVDSIGSNSADVADLQ